MVVSLTTSKSAAGTNFGVPDGASRVDVLQVRGQLFFVPSKGPPLFLCEGISSSWNHGALLLEGSSSSAALLFPLRPEQIARLEDLRMGGKMKLRTTVRVLGVTDQPPQVIQIPELEVRQGSQQFIEIEKSKWVEEILPRMGWGSWKTFEIPLLETSDGLGKIDDLLNEAQKQYGMGNWADCLTACRKAVEELQPYAKEFVNPAHSDEKGGPAPQKIEELGEEFKDLGRSMLEFQSKVRKMLAAGAHKLPPGTTLERADAEFGLLLVVALRRYVGLRMSNAKPRL